MKKTIALTLCLAIVSVSVLVFTGASLGSKKEAVEIGERVVFGDPSAAEGIKVETLAHYDNHLLWHTSYKVGQKPECKTEYEFHTNEYYEKAENAYRGSGVMLSCEVYPSVNLNLPAEEQEGLARELKLLYDATEPGKQSEKTVNLKDYYEYYPINVHVSLPGVYWSGNDYDNLSDEGYNGERQIWDRFRDYFKIPVRENDKRTLTVSRGSNGVSVGIGSTTVSADGVSIIGGVSSYYMDSITTHTYDKCFFTITNGHQVDMSLVQGGYGVYSIDYAKGAGSSNTGVKKDSLTTVLSLDENAVVKRLSVSDDEEQLLIYTSENGYGYLTVMDIESSEVLQKIRFGNGNFYEVEEYDDFVVVFLENNNIVVLEKIEGDTYEYRFEVPLGKDFLYKSSRAHMDFNGEKLAIVSYLYDDYYETCSFCLEVYDDSGLLYSGEYKNSLSLGGGNINYNYRCRAMWHKVSW